MAGAGRDARRAVSAQYFCKYSRESAPVLDGLFPGVRMVQQEAVQLLSYDLLYDPPSVRGEVVILGFA